MKTSENTTPKIVQRKIIPAKRSEVFDAWTKPEIMQQWFIPPNGSATTKNELHVGGRYEHNMIKNGPNACDGSENKPGTCYAHTGEYLEIKSPEKLVFTWNTALVSNTRVTVELRDLGSSTELTLTHEFLETEPLRKAHADGWTHCLNNLETLYSK